MDSGLRYSVDLATITSIEEDAFLRNVSGFVSPPFPIANNRIWIGAFQPVPELVSEGWEWTTGEPWAFTDRGPGEPNDGLPSFHEDAGFIDILPSRRHWVDGERNSLQGGFVVEYDAFGASAPEPPTIVLLLGICAVVRRSRRNNRERRGSGEEG